MQVAGKFQTPEQAHLARLHLGAHGIESHLFDEYIVQNEWVLSDAFGGVRLMVADQDWQAAQEVLSGGDADSSSNLSSLPAEDEERAAGSEEVAAEDRCPQCQSTNIMADTQPQRWACFTMIFFQAPLVCLGTTMYCGDCQHSWALNAPDGQTRPWRFFQFFGGQLFIVGVVLFLLGWIPIWSRWLVSQSIISSQSGLYAYIAAHRDASMYPIPPVLMLPGAVLIFLGALLWRKGFQR